MRRRDFIAVGLFGWPSVAFSQLRVWRIGVLDTARAELNKPNLDTFKNRLRELGYFEGRNLITVYRSADGHIERLPALVSELISLHPDVIVVRGTPEVLALKSATSTIPIVMSAVADPVKVGVAASLSRPGGNITGMASFTVETEAKRIQYLNEIVPNMKRVGFVGDLRNPPIQEQWLQVLEAAKLMGVEAIQLDVRSQTDIVQKFELAEKQGVQALRVSVDGTTRPNRPLIIEFAKKHKLPAIYGAREFADEGGLVSFSPDYGHLYWRAATMVDRILKGENTADLPIELPTKFELLLNLKTAKALNLEISPALLARADEVIE